MSLSKWPMILLSHGIGARNYTVCDKKNQRSPGWSTSHQSGYVWSAQYTMWCSYRHWFSSSAADFWPIYWLATWFGKFCSKICRLFQKSADILKICRYFYPLRGLFLLSFLWALARKVQMCAIEWFNVLWNVCLYAQELREVKNFSTPLHVAPKVLHLAKREGGGGQGSASWIGRYTFRSSHRGGGNSLRTSYGTS